MTPGPLLTDGQPFVVLGADPVQAVQAGPAAGGGRRAAGGGRSDPRPIRSGHPPVTTLELP
jgi:hypothetical protein